MSERTVIKLCWFHSQLEQYRKVFDVERIIVQNVGADYDNCMICQEFGKLKDIKEVDVVG